MINRITILGRLARDPELRNTQTGTAVTSFTLAVDRNRKDADGNTPVDWIDCIAWQKTAEILAQYARKGALIGVTGRLQSRKFTAKDGATRTAWEVVVDEFSFCERRQDAAPAPAPAPVYAPPAAAPEYTANGPTTATQQPLDASWTSADAYDDGSDLPF